jgi:hypothetical protein
VQIGKKKRGVEYKGNKKAAMLIAAFMLAQEVLELAKYF